MPISKDEWLPFETNDISAVLTCIALTDVWKHFSPAFAEIAAREAEVFLKEKNIIFSPNHRLLKAALEASRAASPLPMKPSASDDSLAVGRLGLASSFMLA